MSIFASIKFIQEYRKVVYYSVVLNGEEHEESLFETFINKFANEEKTKLNHILSWIREIGEKHGALPHFFREENYAKALPPQGINKEPCYIENNIRSANPLRLYGHRLNNQIVILFSGGIKTADTAQQCDQVRMHFMVANKLSKSIDKSIQEGEIEWDENGRDILYDKDYKLYY